MISKFTLSKLNDLVSQVENDEEDRVYEHLGQDCIFEVFKDDDVANGIYKGIQLRDSVSILFTGEYAIDMSAQSAEDIVEDVNYIISKLNEFDIDYVIEELQDEGYLPEQQHSEEGDWL